MLIKVSTPITTDVNGAATVYLGSKIRGYLHSFTYRPGTIVSAASLTLTAEKDGTPIYTKANMGTADTIHYPRGLPENPATGAHGTVPAVRIPLYKDRIKVVVAAGGNTLTGSIEALYEIGDDD
jgi:hypothetical protein